uniref:Uncharacterized protein n=1 Tax=Arundo donax TaxID=35708 RepID=A0A0A9HVC3_ARUDO
MSESGHQKHRQASPRHWTQLDFQHHTPMKPHLFYGNANGFAFLLKDQVAYMHPF